MSKYHFTVKHEGRTFKGYLNKEGEVCLIDDDNTPQVVAKLKSIDDVDAAKAVAKKKLASLGW